jgi:transposase
MRRGERKLVDGAGTPEYVHVFGAYNWRTARVDSLTARRKNSETFIAFLEQLYRDYPHQRLILVMDNASYHHSRATRAALALMADRLLVVWLPKYSPFLNPIERFWLHFKILAVANRLHRSLDELTATVARVLDDQSTCKHPNRFLFVDNFWLAA